MLFRIACLFYMTVVVLQSMPTNSKPICTSHFDFLEKLLERLLKIEMTVSLMEEKVNSFTETVDTKIDSFTGTIESDHVKNEAFISEYDTKVSIMEETILANIGHCNKTLSGLKKTVEAEIQSMIEHVHEKFSELKGESAKKNMVFQVEGVTEKVIADNVIKFDTIMTNVDDVFDLSTGSFVTPQHGTYWFAVQLCTHSRTHFSPSITVNDVLVNRGYSQNNADNDCSTVTAVAVLQPGDKVCVKAGPKISSNPIDKDDHYFKNTFMGARLN